MEAVEFMPRNGELRSLCLFFRDRTCSGITWAVDNGARVAIGQQIGRFEFTNAPAVGIVAPIDGTLMRRYDPDVAALPHRPSVLIAWFASDEELMRGAEGGSAAGRSQLLARPDVRAEAGR